MTGQEEGKTSFFEKKEAKKLFLSGSVPAKTPMPQIKKVFCFFFPKKKPFLPLFSRQRA
jgi:hypothetical protein